MSQGTVERMAPCPGGRGVICICTGGGGGGGGGGGREEEGIKTSRGGVTARVLSVPILQTMATFEYLNC